MKAIILNAGRARRMGKLRERPKCLLSIEGKCLLWHQIKCLLGVGVDEITIVIGYKGEEIASEIKKYKEAAPFLRCVFNPFYFFSDSIVSLWVGLKESHSSLDDTVILSGDRALDPEIYRTVGNPLSSSIVALGPAHSSLMARDGIILSRDGKRIVDIGTESFYLSGGLVYVSHLYLDYLLGIVEKIIEKGRIKEWYLGAIRRLCQDVRFSPLIFPLEYCVNVNRPEDLSNPLTAQILHKEVD